MKVTDPQQVMQVREQMFSGKALFLLGPRGAGKRDLVDQLCADAVDSCMMLDGDEPSDRQRVRDAASGGGLALPPGSRTLCFMEVHRLSGISALIPNLLDSDLQLIFCASIRHETVAALQAQFRGKRATFHILPVSMAAREGDLHTRMVYGSYPDALSPTDSTPLLLRDRLRSTIQREVLQSGEVRKPEVMDDLLLMLARNLGNELIIRDLSLTLDLDPKTILRYIGLLEKAFLVFRIPSYFGALENEVTASRKLFFYDNGIRNAVLDSFQPVANRSDAPALWENFLMSERLKQLNVRRERVGVYYWRSTQRQQVSYLERREEGIRAWQFNWMGKKQVRFPKTFTVNYQPIAQEEVRVEHCREFLGLPDKPLNATAPEGEAISDAAVEPGAAHVAARATATGLALRSEGDGRGKSALRPGENPLGKPALSSGGNHKRGDVDPVPSEQESAPLSETAADEAPSGSMSTSVFRNVLADLRKKSRS